MYGKETDLQGQHLHCPITSDNNGTTMTSAPACDTKPEQTVSIPHALTFSPAPLSSPLTTKVPSLSRTLARVSSSSASCARSVMGSLHSATGLVKSLFSTTVGTLLTPKYGEKESRSKLELSAEEVVQRRGDMEAAAAAEEEEEEEEKEEEEKEKDLISHSSGIPKLNEDVESDTRKSAQWKADKEWMMLENFAQPPLYASTVHPTVEPLALDSTWKTSSILSESSLEHASGASLDTTASIPTATTHAFPRLHAEISSCAEVHQLVPQQSSSLGSLYSVSKSCTPAPSMTESQSLRTAVMHCDSFQQLTHVTGPSSALPVLLGVADDEPLPSSWVSDSFLEVIVELLLFSAEIYPPCCEWVRFLGQVQFFAMEQQSDSWSIMKSFLSRFPSVRNILEKFEQEEHVFIDVARGRGLTHVTVDSIVIMKIACNIAIDMCPSNYLALDQLCFSLEALLQRGENTYFDLKKYNSALLEVTGQLLHANPTAHKKDHVCLEFPKESQIQRINEEERNG